jgi:ATP-dependent DNA helicase RecG
MSKHENEELEFKKSTSELKEAVISLSSMLNKNNHGVVFFGIKNDGTVCGQEVGEFTTSKIVNEIKNNIKPYVSAKVETIKEDDKTLIRVEAYGEDTPYSAYGRYYKRSDDQDLQMAQNELEEYFENKHFSYTKWEKKLTEYGEEDVDEELLIKYIDKANDLNRLNYRYESVVETMTKLGLMEKGKLNNAGFYLFSNKKPLLVKLARYVSDERTSFIDNRQFMGNIFECIDASVNYILSSINFNAVIEGLQRVEKPEIPIEAIREIVVNSFAHMRVVDGDYNEITITPSSVRVYNPGTIALNEDPKAFANGEIGSKLRNPLIAMALYRNKTIEAFGTGFKRVFDLCNRENVTYSYKTEGLGFSFTFRRGPTDLLVAEKPTVYNPKGLKLSQTEIQIIDIAKENGTITSITEVSQRLNKPYVSVQRAIQSLVQKKKLERIGAKKDGYWKLK